MISQINGVGAKILSNATTDLFLNRRAPVFSFDMAFDQVDLFIDRTKADLTVTLYSKRDKDTISSTIFRKSRINENLEVTISGRTIVTPLTLATGDLELGAAFMSAFISSAEFFALTWNRDVPKGARIPPIPNESPVPNPPPQEIRHKAPGGTGGDPIRTGRIVRKDRPPTDAEWDAYFERLRREYEDRNKVPPGGDQPRSGGTIRKDGPTIQPPKCISHDMNCTFIGNVVHARFFGYSFEINIRDCCVKHDVQMWCGPCNPNTAKAELQEMNWNLARCVFDKIYTAIFQGMPWYLGGVLTGAAYGLIVATVTFVLVFAAVQLATFASLVLLGNQDQYPLFGQNRDSCLCGGTRQTNDCTTGENLCTRYKNLGKPCDDNRY